MLNAEGSYTRQEWEEKLATYESCPGCNQKWDEVLICPDCKTFDSKRDGPTYPCPRTLLDITERYNYRMFRKSMRLAKGEEEKEGKEKAKEKEKEDASVSFCKLMMRRRKMRRRKKKRRRRTKRRLNRRKKRKTRKRRRSMKASGIRTATGTMSGTRTDSWCRAGARRMENG